MEAERALYYESRLSEHAIDVLMTAWGYCEEVKSLAQKHIDRYGHCSKMIILANGNTMLPDITEYMYATVAK